jgi:hypothetical protein
MVGVVVRRENVGEPEPLGFESALDRVGLGGVDDPANALRAVEDEIGIVVPEAGNEVDFERGHGASLNQMPARSTTDFVTFL